MSSKILKYFAFAHLPPALQVVSSPFCVLATMLDETLPESAEKSSCLRYLLIAKDAAVRAALEKEDPDAHP